MNEQKSRNTGTAMATHEEICDDALEHYDKLATECHHWYNVVPKAIEFYKMYGKKNTLRVISDSGFISDGYHTFDELYEHRAVLFIKLCEKIQDFLYHGDMRNRFGDERIVWRSKKHSDGTMFDGWFIMGICMEKEKQITYHLPLEKWDDTDFADTLRKAPEWDGHTPQDVLERLAKI